MIHLLLKAMLSVTEPAPQYLYKVLSAEDWTLSQNQNSLSLPAADDRFIHFSREDQLERILVKYWGDVSEYYILKVDTSALPGHLVFETNPGSATKYYHLYDGSIPLESVVETQNVKR